MPHLILECSEHLKPLINLNNIFSDLHQYLALTLPTQITSCKSRASFYENHYVGDDFENQLFMHLTIKILAGRSDDIKNKVGEFVLNYLKRELEQAGVQNTSISVELGDLSPFYFKCDMLQRTNCISI